MRLSRMNAAKYAQMIGMMIEQPHTITNMAKTLDLARHVVAKYVKALHEARPKLVHIAEWQQARLTTAPVWVAAYGWGGERDQRRPPKKTMIERCRAYRARRKLRTLDAMIAGVNR